jgi:hypothetical protein
MDLSSARLQWQGFEGINSQYTLNEILTGLSSIHTIGISPAVVQQADSKVVNKESVKEDENVKEFIDLKEEMNFHIEEI